MSSGGRGNLFPGINTYLALHYYQLNDFTIQIARGLVLPLTISVTSLSSHSHPAARVIVAAAVVTLGFFIGVAPEGNIPTSSIPSALSLFYAYFPPFPLPSIQSQSSLLFLTATTRLSSSHIGQMQDLPSSSLHSFFSMVNPPRSWN